jgi:hypothetical protein
MGGRKPDQVAEVGDQTVDLWTIRDDDEEATRRWI